MAGVEARPTENRKPKLPLKTEAHVRSHQARPQVPAPRKEVPTSGVRCAARIVLGVLFGRSTAPGFSKDDIVMVTGSAAPDA